ncbi:hypothetical protein ANTPLA_LOCUS5887 [Anthophora plagiata]
MNRIIKKLIMNSILVRNCSILQKYTVIQSHMYSSEDALAYRASGTVKVNSSSMINEIENNIKDMQASTTISLNKAIQIVYKLENIFKGKKLHYKELENSEEITYVFKVIHKNAQLLQKYHIIHILKILVIWNVPHHTTLVQTLLQLICASVNDLSIEQIVVMHNILRKMKWCPLTDSLNIALCQVFKQKVKIELNSNYITLIAALKYASFINDKNSIYHIINKLVLKPYKLQISNVVHLYALLYNIPETIETKILLNHMQNVIKTNYRNLTMNNITYILHYICESCLNNTMKLYDEKTVCALYAAAFKNDITFHENITILKYLNKMRYSCADFLNSLAETCIQHKDNVDKFPVDDLIHFIESFVIADYKPKNWKFLQTILENDITNADCSLQTAVPLSFSLLSLDCYYPKLLEKICTLYNKVTIINNETTLGILKLYWCIKLLYPASNDVLLDESKLNEVKIRLKEDHISCLMESLKEACGGDKYMKGGLKTKWGLLVDNIVVKQPDGSLMDISSYDNITFIEELASLSECDKILFIALKKEAYSINLKYMLSTVKIQLRAIKQLPGYHVFVVNPFSWENLSHKEKVAHLQQAIKKNYSNISDI